VSEATNLIALNNFQPCFDVREEVRCSEDGLPLVLLPQVTVRSATLSERCRVHESLYRNTRTCLTHLGVEQHYSADNRTMNIGVNSAKYVVVNTY
jgi:hypothetical protein